MASYELKTKITDVKVGNFLDGVADERQREDAYKIIEMMERLTGHPPKMWGPSIVGFGQYHYKYASGHEGDMARIGFSPRKGNTVLYITDGYDKYADLMAQLGKHKTGRSCLYVKRLSDIDEAVLEKLCMASLAYMAEKYPD